YGWWTSTIGGGTSAVPSIMPGPSSPLAADDLIEINSIIQSAITRGSITASSRRKGQAVVKQGMWCSGTASVACSATIIVRWLDAPQSFNHAVNETRSLNPTQRVGSN